MVEKACRKRARLRVWRFQQFLWRAEQDHFTVLEQCNTARQEKCFGDVVSDKYHGFAEFLLQRFEFLLDFTPSDRVKGAERLVEQNYRRIGGQGACHSDPLTLAAGQLARQSIGKPAGVEADEL